MYFTTSEAGEGGLGPATVDKRLKRKTASAPNAPAEPAAQAYSTTALLLPPAILCGAMLLVGWATSRLAGVQIGGLFSPYLETALLFTFMSLCGFIFIEIVKLACVLADRPIGTVREKLRGRMVLLVLPGFLFPLFLGGFTAAKSAIVFLVGYSWDGFWAAADRMVFGNDVWRIAYALLGSAGMRVCEWFYTVAWGFALLLCASFVTLYGQRRTIGIFYTAMFATWLIGGCFMAYAFSAAGPVFAGVFDPSLQARFGEIRQVIAANIGGGPIDETQRYLLSSVYSHVAAKGGGISAMPSMHLGAAAIYVLAARGTRWLLPAIAFWLMIFFCSGYFGYHYWVDGIVGALVAGACWKASAVFYDRIGRRVETSPAAECAA
jgi:PAP2 superfamily